MTSAIAVLVFLFVVVLVAGGWWVSQVSRNLRSRLSRAAPVGSTQVLRPEIEKGDGAIEQLLGRSGLPDRLASLAAQAGYRAAVTDVTLRTRGGHLPHARASCIDPPDLSTTVACLGTLLPKRISPSSTMVPSNATSDRPCAQFVSPHLTLGLGRDFRFLPLRMW